MKKIIIILLIALYLIPTAGFSLSAHYCGNKLASVSLGFLNTKKCPCGNKKMNRKCCKTKIFSLKISDSQKQTPALTLDFNKNFKIQPEVAAIKILYRPVTIVTFSFNNPPPDPIKQQLCLRNQVSRI